MYFHCQFEILFDFPLGLLLGFMFYLSFNSSRIFQDLFAVISNFFPLWYENIPHMISILLNLFSCFLWSRVWFILVNATGFCWKLNTVFQVTKTEVNRPMVSGFVVTWLGVGLCLMFTVRVGGKVFIFIVFLSLLLILGFLKYSFSDRDYILQLRSVVILCYHNITCWCDGMVLGPASVL